MISTTPADITTRRAIPLTGTWFHHVGRAPYELLGLVDHTSGRPSRRRPGRDCRAGT